MTNITINVEEKIWKELTLIKINAGYKTISDVLEHLLFNKKEIKDDKSKI